MRAQIDTSSTVIQLYVKDAGAGQICIYSSSNANFIKGSKVIFASEKYVEFNKNVENATKLQRKLASQFMTTIYYETIPLIEIVTFDMNSIELKKIHTATWDPYLPEIEKAISETLSIQVCFNKK